MKNIRKYLKNEKTIYVIDNKELKDITVSGRIKEFQVAVGIDKEQKDKNVCPLKVKIDNCIKQVKNSLYLIEKKGSEFFEEYVEKQDRTRRDEVPMTPKEDIYPVEYITLK